MGRLVTVATCNLNQWTLDWEGNANRIIESIRRAKAAGARLRVGPELEITGYGCLDHFLEGDTFLHSWEMLARIIDHPDCQDIICDVGMPVRHRNIRFNARVLFYNRKILYIRPKQFLAQDGNYREMRYFTPWPARKVERYYLESVVAKVTGQDTVDIGDCVLSTRDTCIGAETCEELFTPNAPHIQYGLNGVEIFTNSSGSHFESRKQATRISLIVEATRMVGGIYLYANQRGCDGDRLYYDGGAMIIVNGNVLAQASRFSLHEVEVITATIDIEDVRSFRCSPSRGLQATAVSDFTRIEVNMKLSDDSDNAVFDRGPSPEIAVRYASPAEEIALAPGAFLWDFLRRSPAAGFFIPLSGGIDSCATSVIVFGMCRLAFDAIHHSEDEATQSQALKDCRRICGEPPYSSWIPESPQAICGRIFHTCFMGSVNSSTETRRRAKELARSIGGYHTDLNIDTVVSALTTMFTTITQFQPRFKVHGGSPAENLALQNIQARLRMVIAYMFAQLLPTVRQRRGGGGLLVLGSANVDESLRGYLTKYDCSSADINPIGGISKTDLKMFIGWARDNFGLPILQEFLDAVPTAELEPITETYVQSDEADMGMTYAELSVFGILRKVHKLGPWGMYERLLHLWSRPPPAETPPHTDPTTPSTVTQHAAAAHESADSVHATIHGRGLSPREIMEKVIRFWDSHKNNRHKMTVITPAVHMEQYSPDDNRFDLRPFLYPKFSWAYAKIQSSVEGVEARGRGGVREDGKKVVKGD